MARRTAVRLAIAVLALGVAAGVLAVRQGQRDCEKARNLLFLVREQEGRDLGQYVRAVTEDCSGTETVTDAAAGLLRSGRHEGAAQLARVAVRREPEAYPAWAALAASTARSEPARARAARRRALELNPLAGEDRP